MSIKYIPSITHKFLGIFLQSQPLPISFVMSICLAAAIYKHASHCTDCCEILYREISWNL